MFKIQPNPTFRQKVAIPVAGAAKPAEIEVEYKYLTRDDARVFFDGLEGRKDAEALAEIVTGWSGVDVPYSAENLGLLLNNYLPAARALFDGFVAGINSAKEKN